jgi:serine phosphatase RsbU (regulator of sigma subunit)
MTGTQPETRLRGYLTGEAREREVRTGGLSPQVLCVDDEPNVLEGLRLHLERHYRMSTATSGAEALALLDCEGPYAVVISDMRMPEMDGAAFLSQVRQRFPDTVRLLLTGHADVHSAVTAVNDGQIFRFLTKPCAPAALLSAVQEANEQYCLIMKERLAKARQAETSLENTRLANEVADRMDTERRLTSVMETARDVQLRLLPQALPHLETLDCAATCIQARWVGGDYYDFLDLGPRRTGFVLADVSGKGVYAALLVSNLQAYLRSRSRMTALDPARLLTELNRTFWISTAPEYYATLFFGIYDDCTRELTYVNCGHNAPVLLRPDGSVERLKATGTVIGLFESWQCTVAQVQLAPEDLLVIFSDGVTEADCGDEQFGEARLINELRVHGNLSVSEMVETVLTSVQQFAKGEQSDDLTLLIARARK